MLFQICGNYDPGHMIEANTWYNKNLWWLKTENVNTKNQIITLKWLTWKMSACHKGHERSTHCCLQQATGSIVYHWEDLSLVGSNAVDKGFYICQNQRKARGLQLLSIYVKTPQDTYCSTHDNHGLVNKSIQALS